MATGRKQWNCPICLEVPRDMAHALPCWHEFCLGCILRWLRGNRTCPLCRRVISTVSFSEKEEDYLQCTIRYPREATSQAGSAAGSRDGHRTHGPEASPASALQGTPSPDEPGAAGPEAVGGILPELWAELFRRRWDLLNPVCSWLRQWLQKRYRERWWQMQTAESTIVLALCIFGPDREVLLQRLRPRLQQHAAQLVQGMLSIIETECRQEVQRLRARHAAQDEAESPGSSSGPSASPGDAPASAGPAGSGLEHEASALEESPKGSPSTCRTEPAETEQP